MSNTSGRFRIGLTAVLLFLTTPLTACHIVPERHDTVSESASVAIIVRQPGLFAGRLVTVDAAFAGWKGSCRGPVPATRSDWMIEDGGACLYVTGPLPAGFSAAPPAHGMGEKVSVTGAVELTQDGRTFIRTK